MADIFLVDERNAAAQIRLVEVQNCVGSETRREGCTVRSFDGVALLRLPPIHAVDAVPVVDDTVHLGRVSAGEYGELSSLQTLIFLLFTSQKSSDQNRRRRESTEK